MLRPLYCVPPHKIKLFQDSFQYVAAILWNYLHIEKSQSLNAFKQVKTVCRKSGGVPKVRDRVFKIGRNIVTIGIYTRTYRTYECV